MDREKPSSRDLWLSAGCVCLTVLGLLGVSAALGDKFARAEAIERALPGADVISAAERAPMREKLRGQDRVALLGLSVRRDEAGGVLFAASAMTALFSPIFGLSYYKKWRDEREEAGFSTKTSALA